MLPWSAVVLVIGSVFGQCVLSPPQAESVEEPAAAEVAPCCGAYTRSRSSGRVVDYIIGIVGGFLLAVVAWLISLDKRSPSLDKQNLDNANDTHSDKKKEVRAALAAENAEERIAELINEKLK